MVIKHPRNLPTEEAKGANMIKLTRDGFGTLELYVTFRGKRHVFKHWKYQGWYRA